MTHAPIPAAAIQTHFDATFLTQVPASRLNSVLAAVRSLRLDSITNSTPGSLAFVVTANGTSRLTVNMATDARGLISGLLLRPAGTPPAVPASWSGVDRMIRSVAPHVRFLVAAVNGNTCRPVHAIDATTPAPLGSAFKLYVLDALARAVAAGKVSWDQPLTVTSQVKSLPSGILQDDPDGTRVSVRQVAAGMISISDNTAANMLIALLGRPRWRPRPGKRGWPTPPWTCRSSPRENCSSSSSTSGRSWRSATWPSVVPDGRRCCPAPWTGSG